MSPTIGLFFSWKWIGSKSELPNYLLVVNSGSKNICNSDGIKVTKGLSAQVKQLKHMLD